MTKPPNPDDATRPTVSTDQPTMVSDLSGGGAKPGTDVTLPAGQVRPSTDVTVAAGKPSDVQDALPTQASGPGSTSGSVLSGQVWGDFQFGRLLGRGGMGAVYLARQVSLDRPVAIKVLPAHLSENEQFRERFQLEAKAVAKISSPNVIQVYAAGVHEGQHFFAMEYVEGEDLSRKLRHGFRPNHRQSLELLVQAARGLAGAGEHGIVHRDIKPGNMMIDRKGTLKIMDFGLVKLAAAGSSLTMTGTVMGTVSYFSPEQGRGEPCDQRTDIYALGVVFYELLTGRLPFTGDNATSIIYQHIHVAPKTPRELDPTIPEDYQAVVLKCMQKQAEARYDTAGELLADLEHMLSGRKPAFALSSDPDQLRNGATIVGTGVMAPQKDALAAMRRRRLAIGVGSVAAVLAAVGGAGWWFMRREPPPAPLAPQAPVAPAAPVVQAPAPPPPPTENPEVKARMAELLRNNSQNEARQKVLVQIEGLRADGKLAEAEGQLALLAADAPDDAQVQAALKAVRAARAQADQQAAAVAQTQAALNANLELGDKALAAGDLDAAQAAFTAAGQLDPRDARVAAKLIELERRRAELRAKPPAPLPDPQTGASAAALEQARASLSANDLAEARRLVNVNRGMKADDPQWLALAKALDAAEGRQLLKDAREAFAAGKPEQAAKSAAAAALLLPEDAELKTLQTEMAAAEAKRKAREGVLQEADTLLTEGQAVQAEAALTKLAGEWPDDQTVANALRRAKVAREQAEARAKAMAEQLAQADAALARADIEAAFLAFTAVRNADPKNEKAAAGLEEVGKRKTAVEAARGRLAEAIKAKDEATAAAALEEIKKLWPGGMPAAVAETELAKARTQWAEEKRQAEELERVRQARAKVIAAELDDPRKPVAELEQTLAGFLKEAGDQRPERPELERKLEDRRSADAVVARLAEVDGALQAGKVDAAAVARLCADPEWGRSLVELAAMPGAVFQQQVLGFKRDGDQGVAQVRIRTALPDAPEEILEARYEMKRTPEGWRVSRATLVEKP